MNRFELDSLTYKVGTRTEEVITGVGAWSIFGTVILMCLKGSLLANHPWYYCLVPIGTWLTGSMLVVLALYTWLTILDRNIHE